MSWYIWKWWRIAYSLNKGGIVRDKDGVWSSVFKSRFYFLNTKFV